MSIKTDYYENILRLIKDGADESQKSKGINDDLRKAFATLSDIVDIALSTGKVLDDEQS